ncbi:MAG: tetratricopeptide repeat protein [Planctomycetota bacterium]|jgi:tetratricopeptide (TPR) repeat protein|nr:tetratricopeptide repeat protein [Planctomycetota bacterium]MEC8300168.1 tetratricopeptide repeat protein [Planctomycetota bacterium]MEC8783838.1 tetratricopeptide repeat protein [Planctomycetota bacterium]MEC9190038.1 tetratricopeptide repeat protein [Planctomycetota bacterium]MEE3076028.1 tetratricopeptide repeat protein [Planctomycetota bacterium]
MSKKTPKSKAETSGVPARDRPSKSGLLSKISLIVLTVLGTAGMLAGVIWLREQPVRQAEALLVEGLADQSTSADEGRETESSKIRDAYHTISEYLEKYPTDSKALALQARILLYFNRPEEAIEIFTRVGPDTLVELQDFARCYIAMEDYNRALSLIEEVLRQDPNYSDALYEASTCRAKLGRFQEALDSAATFAAQPGNEAKGYLLMASVHTELKNRPAAIASFAKVLEFEPDAERLGIPPWQFYFLYGGLLLENGEPDKGLPLLQKSLGQERHPDTYTRIGECQAALGETSKAESAWRMALGLIPNYTPAIENLANLELSRGKPENALELIEPLKDTVSSSTLAYSLQRIYLAQGNQEEADKWKEKSESLRKGETLVRAINDVLTNQPESLWGIALQAHRSGAKGDWERADELFSVLKVSKESDPFLQELQVAVQQKRNDLLPRLELLPIDLQE